MNIKLLGQIEQKANYIVPVLYLILSVIFHGIGINLFSTVLAPGDGFVQGVPYAIFSSSTSLWNPYTRSGISYIIDPVSQSSYLPTLLIMKIFPAVIGYNLLLLLHYAAAGFFTYIYLKTLKINKAAAFIGGLCFMFFGFLSAHKGHNTMVSAAVWLPLILYFVERYFENRKLKYLFFSSLGFALSILAGYPAVSMYTGMIVLPYIIFRVLSINNYNTFSKKIGTIIASNSIIFIGALLLSAIIILPIIESLPFITRDKISYDFFSGYSFSLTDLPLLLFPYFYGNDSPGYTPYFGPWNLTEITGYMGILPLSFAFLSLILWRKENRQIIFWSVIAASGFILALGDSTPLYRLMYHIPIYNLFRIPARNWFEVNFAVAILAGFFVHYSATTKASKYFNRWTKILVLILIMSILVIFGIAKIVQTSSIIKDTNKLNLFIENTQLSSPAIYIPLLIISISIIFILLIDRYFYKKLFLIFMVIFIFMDLFSFGHFYDNIYGEVPFENREKNEIYNFLKADGTGKDFRVLPLEVYEKELYPNLNMIYGINVINGYGPIWLKNYKLLTSFEANGIPPNYQLLISNSKVMSILSTRYVLTADEKKMMFIESIMATTQNISPDNIINGFFQDGWNILQSSKKDKEVVVLQSYNGKDVSIVQKNFKLEKNENYMIFFEARSINLEEPLIVDFYNMGYDTTEQERQFDYQVISKDFKNFYAVFNSGINPPENAYLRFFTLSKIPVEIKNVVLTKVNSIYYWGSKQEGVYPLYKKVYENKDKVAIYENMNFLPRARFVQNVTSVKNFDETNRILQTDIGFDPSIMALVENYHGSITLNPGEVITTDHEKNDILKLSVETGGNSFLVLSDTWYPGWKAYIDGKETEIYKTNGMLRGIFIEGEGLHNVEFVFSPESYYIGFGISILTLVFIVGYVFYKK